MKNIFALIAGMVCVLSAAASSFSYNFKSERLSEALTRIAEEHPEIRINFIYNELDHYNVTAIINTDNPFEALRRTIGLNPVSIINKGNRYYIEALQKGKYKYSGQVVDTDNEPVVGASVVLLVPRDSTVITYGSTDADGKFSIPCDKKSILVKFSCVGYKTTYINSPRFSMGTVKMELSPIVLSGVSVEGENTVLATDKNIYIPTSRQKNASQDATDLLRRMAIPQLVINPGNNKVKDVFGNNVSIFINYHEADPDELRGMNITDVRKVEFIEFPTDPRFKGEEHVINFIVQGYEYGGYTKASESFRTGNGVYNNIDVFSRFTYKMMTYDVYAGSDNQHFHHSGTDNLAVYRLDDKDDQVDVIRKETFRESETRIDEFPLTFRASYYSARFTARNTLSFTHYSAPRHSSCGDLTVNIHPESDYSYFRSAPNRNNTVYYYSNLWGAIGSKASFDIMPSFRHTHRNNTSLYESALMQKPVYNLITENTYNWGLQATGRIGLGQKSQLSLFIAGGQNIFKLLYQGTNSNNDSYYNSFMAADMRYSYQTKKITVTSFAGLGFDHNSMNGISTQDIFPRLGVSARLSINKKSQVSAYLYYQTTTPGIGMKANDIVQSNEFMYLTGNPDLKNWRNLTSNVAYNIYFNNSLSIAAFTGYNQDFNRVATVYIPYDNGNALLRDYINDGAYRHYYLGVQANYKLFNNSLQLYANLTQNAYEITGRYKDSLYPFRVQLQAAYYWKSFNILASWGNPQHTLTENANYTIRGRNFHMFSIGWGNGTWNVNLAAKNIFNKGWRYETWEKSSPLYSEYQQFYNPSFHRSVTLSVTYTIGYGKKIQRGNEAGAASASPSAIIE